MGKQCEQWETFIFLGSKITADGDCSHKIKRCLLLGRKAMTNLKDSILKSRDITLQTNVCIVRAMVFPVAMYGCESWTMKKAECQIIDAFELWCWRRLLRVPWTAMISNQSILKKIGLFATPMDYIVHGILQARILLGVAAPFSRGSFQPRDWTQVFHIAGGFFTSWATGKSKNTGVGSLSLLHLIFLTQELNQGLLHQRWILYQLSYQGSW